MTDQSNRGPRHPDSTGKVDQGQNPNQNDKNKDINNPQNDKQNRS